jgi:hypothetical protein
MKTKVKAYTLEIMLFTVKKILLYDLALVLVVALSFLLFPPFTITAYSERLIWTGIGVALVAGVVISSQTIGGRNYGVANTYSSAYSQDLIDFNIQARQAIETKMGGLMRLFFIGVILFGIGVLVQVLFV